MKIATSVDNYKNNNKKYNFKFQFFFFKFKKFKFIIKKPLPCNTATGLVFIP